MNLWMKNSGFTLLEVLIALAILSIAFTAIIKSSMQNIKDTYYLQQKNRAAWVAAEVVNEVRARVLIVPEAPDSLEQTRELLGEEWLVKASLMKTKTPKIHEIHTAVYRKKDEEFITRLIGYLYAP